MRVFITGNNGSLGRALQERITCVGADIDTMDVRDERSVQFALLSARPDVIFHLAGAKHAPEGEIDPWGTAETNVVGTRNVLKHRNGAKVIVASTCKACDPETTYGASKLLAERMALEAAQSVARFFNVVETRGNVFEIWENTAGPLPVTTCWRYFISLEQAVTLLLACMDLEPGRYAVDPGESVFIPQLAHDLYPRRAQTYIEPRRGDRLVEPLHAKSETWAPIGDGIMRIHSVHDRAEERVLAVA